MISELSRKEWCESRGVSPKEAHKLCNQIRDNYIYLKKVLKGEPTPTELLERDLILLVEDVKAGRIPLERQARTKCRTPSVQVG